jgi:pimeloyl-ACP methyl ester carboxylesterase
MPQGEHEKVNGLARLPASRRLTLSALLLPFAGLLPTRAGAQPVPASRPVGVKAVAGNRKFVLVHGAYSGGWIWKMTADVLRASGHEVWTPTLTGLGERSHLAASNVNMTTHIQDVVNCLRWEGLDGQGITLVGHSYAGSVLSGVAELLTPDTVDALVIIDGALPLDGQSHFSYFGRPTDNLPATLPLGENIGEEYAEPIRSWLRERMTPHPAGSFVEPLHLTGALERIRSKTFVKAIGPGTVTFPHRTVERIIEDPTWRYEELPCGHNTLVEMPEETARILERAALA